MAAPKNYSVRSLAKEDEAAVESLLLRHPLWKRKHAREQVAMQKFAARIKGAK